MDKTDSVITKKARHFSIGKWVAALIGIATPIVYLNGRAYHDGYLAYFHLDTSMFPIDVPSTFVLAARAWLEGATVVLTSTAQALKHHWFVIIVVPIVLVGTFSALAYGVGRRLQRSLEKKTDGGSRHLILPPAFRMALGSVTTLIFGAYGLYTFFTIIGAALLLFVAPFVGVGKAAAERDSKIGFSSSPSVELSDAHLSPSIYRIIECSDKFCALYSTDDIATVAISSVTLAISHSQPKIVVKIN
jgi:hypothetical protein